MSPKPDYFIVTREIGAWPRPWCWELRRHSGSMSVKVGEDGYESQSAAEQAGKRVLAEFLAALENERRQQ